MGVSDQSMETGRLDFVQELGAQALRDRLNELGEVEIVSIHMSGSLYTAWYRQTKRVESVTVKKPSGKEKK